MADSSIEWTDKVWNPVVGCTRVSAGCEHCYAERLAHRLALMGQAQYAGLTRKLPNGEVRWTGKAVCLPERLSQPLRWRKPARIFVNSMSDLFHEDVPDEFINQVFAAMNFADWHTFQVLTKRPDRMRRFVRDHVGRQPIRGLWPLPNVWLGVSVEDQCSADERIPLLLQTPAAVRFLSCEPLLGPIDLREWLPYYTACGASRDAETQVALDDVFRAAVRHMGGPSLHWCIAGGESGPNFRPLNLDWARSLRDQCQVAGVAYHFKQVGGRTHAAGGRLLDGRTWDEFPEPRRELVHA